MKSTIISVLYVITAAIPIGYVISMIPSSMPRFILALAVLVLAAVAMFHPSSSAKIDGDGR